MIEICQEKPGDEGLIRYVNEQAFSRADEANLVDALRKRNALVLSMIALEDSQIVGHIAFTEVMLCNSDCEFRAIGLGPMSVLPSYQRRGIGTQLIRAALDRCRQLGHEIVVVVGYPEFYSRFGFVPAKPRGLECEFDVPDDAFMVLELRRGVLAGRSGVVHYQDEFRQV
jgi:putative acetyltransferase